MNRGSTGRYEVTVVNGEAVRAFIPTPLPPIPPLDFPVLASHMEQALLALGRLDSLSRILPNIGLFLYCYVRKEAVLSSQIEGTQSSLSDLLMFELDRVPDTSFDDVGEVSNYVAALEHGLHRLDKGFPLCNRLVREMHAILLQRGRGGHQALGEFRRSQNWIDGRRPGVARFVPPPVSAVADCMSDLERYLHENNDKTSLLLRAGLAHVQFETIHPFLDGNGRIGRLLIAVLLHHGRVLRHPLLYLSLYFKQHRDDYYSLLNETRTSGDWEAWLKFFLHGVAETAGSAVDMARRLLTLFEQDQTRIKQEAGRKANSSLRVHQVLQERPIASLSQLAARAGISFPTGSAGIEFLQNAGIVRELTRKKRNRLFSYVRYLNILSEGTEPL